MSLVSSPGTPDRPPLASDGWRPSSDFEPLTFEKVVGLNTLFSIAWLTRGLELSAPVARITTQHGPATGFLIANDLLLTNHHVFPDAEAAASAYMELNYQTSWS